MRKFRNLISVAFLTTGTYLFGSSAITVIPTTTLATETANNTSAPDTISDATNGIASSGNISKMPFRDLLYPGATTKIYTTLLGWFEESGHITIGYNSQDSALVSKQIADMQSRGVDGTFLAWYGQDSYEDTTAHVLRQQSEAHPGFNFGIMIDHGAITWDSVGLNATDALIRHFNYVAQNYYSSPAYFRINGRPVVMEFGMELETIDWNKVRANAQGNPLIIFRNANGFSRPTADGGYAWGPADPIGYLDYFYSQSLNFANELTMGGSAKGFNDKLATWTENRITDEQCGQTWLNSIADAGNYYSANRQLPLMMIATWNDYEEGTTIESGIDNCLNISASTTSRTLTWSLSGQGQENTVDHYSVFVSTDAQNLMPLANVSSGTHSLDLSTYTFAPGTYTMYVKAVGKSSIKNQMSNPAAFTISVSKPVAKLSLTSSSGTAPVNVDASTAASSSPNGQITSSSIDFGDGSKAGGPEAKHVYSQVGTYTVTATVTDNAGASATATSKVIVSPRPLIVSRPGRPLRASVGSTAAAKIPVTTTVASGNSNASLTVAPSAPIIAVRSGSANAGISQSSVPVNVASAQPLTAKLTLSTTHGNGPLSVKASTTGSTGAIASTRLNFGDGTSITGTSATHIYNKPGIYKVVATVTESSAASSTASGTVTVNGVVISSPVQGNDPASVKLTANAIDTKPIAAMIAYIDDVEVYRTYSARLASTLNLASGTHILTVNAWEDVTGVMYTSEIAFNVP